MRNQIDIDFSCIMQEVENWPHTGDVKWHDNRKPKDNHNPEKPKGLS